MFCSALAAGETRAAAGMALHGVIFSLYLHSCNCAVLSLSNTAENLEDGSCLAEKVMRARPWLLELEPQLPPPPPPLPPTPPPPPPPPLPMSEMDEMDFDMTPEDEDGEITLTPDGATAVGGRAVHVSPFFSST